MKSLHSKSVLTAALLGLVASTGHASKLGLEESIPRVKIIYGDDDRRDLYQVTDPLALKLADSTVALFNTRDARFRRRYGVQLKGGSFQQQKKVCDSEPFADQPAGAFCSGTLVAKNLVLTAGHCIESANDCGSTVFVFGFGVKDAGEYPYQADQSEVYECHHIVTRFENKDGKDYALIALDRNVDDHSPVALASAAEANPAVGSSVLMIGHPYGLPTKVDAGGRVRANTHRNYFLATTDSYKGSSGSGVFDPVTGKLIGVLTSGETNEFMFDYPGKCYVSRVCEPDKCDGEQVTRVSFLSSLIEPYL